MESPVAHVISSSQYLIYFPVVLIWTLQRLLGLGGSSHGHVQCVVVTSGYLPSLGLFSFLLFLPFSSS